MTQAVTSTMTYAGRSMMTSAGTQDDDVSNDAGPDVGRKLDRRPTKVGRELDG
jgi:hypothetical protein